MSQPIDLEFDTLEEALEAAELYTSLDREVTKPLPVSDKYCIRITD